MEFVFRWTVAGGREGFVGFMTDRSGAFLPYTHVTSLRRMSQPTGSNGKQQYTTLVVSPEYRDKIRVAKAEDGLSYEEYLARHLPIQPES